MVEEIRIDYQPSEVTSQIKAKKIINKSISEINIIERNLIALENNQEGYEEVKNKIQELKQKAKILDKYFVNEWAFNSYPTKGINPGFVSFGV